MRTQDAKRIPLRDLLSWLGQEPVADRAGDVWYNSPFRAETKPSFHINEAMNSWYDFGLASGGNVIDFAMQYFGVKDVPSALRHLDDVVGGKAIVAQPATQPNVQPKAPVQPAQEHSAMHAVKVQPLQHWGLLDYLKKRGIDTNVSRSHVQEIYYTVREGQQKPYFALAFPNRSANGTEGYEIRNAYVKGCIGKKDLSLIPSKQENDSTAKRVCVFEGFMDYLSFLTLQKKRQLDTSVIVLNGIPMGERAMALLRDMHATEVQLYLDHDEAGRTLTARFQHELEGVHVVDASRLYDGYKDMNEFLQKQRQSSMAL